MNKKLLTLCLIARDNTILLGMKKRGFGEGWWNGFGGKVEPGETIEAAACRELQEEVGITAHALEQRGVLEFHFENQETVLEVHIFFVTDYTGEPQESDEMKPAWFTYDHIPFESMWPDDRYWIPLFLEGKYFTGTFSFNSERNIVDHHLCEVTSDYFVVVT